MLTLRGAALLFLTYRIAHASDPFIFCTDNECDDCPVHLTDLGTGYPDCVIYSTEDVFGGQDDFEGSENGGYSPFLSVPQPDPGCEIIIKSPAGLDVEGCGYSIGSYSHAACSHVEIDTTFMVQFCCGSGDCTAATGSRSLQRSARFNDEYLVSRSGGGGSLYLSYPNGTMIQPAQVGKAPENTYEATQNTKAVESPTSLDIGHHTKRDGNPDGWGNCPNANTPAEKRGLPMNNLTPRDCKFDKDSWVADGASYTRPSDVTTVVLGSVDGGTDGVDYVITHERSQSWTSSESVDLGFADIISLGVSFSEEYNCQVSDGQQTTFHVGTGQVGDVVFTPFLNCQRGTYTCDGARTDTVEFCAAYRIADQVAGIMNVEVHN
ncbi:hypothetical protein F5Y18DRAFT_415458 [Xylariaceae sp. FL1019]|nr:hypothetical protein F5Y18DRAFT_415458 [Xylariaceae sp. FL1019]